MAGLPLSQPAQSTQFGPSTKLKLIARFSKALDRRPLFPETSLAKAQLQLLPGVVYEPKLLQKGLHWQRDYLAAHPESARVTVTVVVLNEPESELRRYFESLAVQSSTAFDIAVLVADPDYSPDAIAKLFDEFGLAGSLFVAEQKLERAHALRLLLREVDSTYLLINSVQTILNPQALYVLAKELRGRSPELVFANEVILNPQTLRAERYIRRSAFDRYSLLARNVVGGSVFVSAKRMRRVAEDDGFLNCSSELIPWFIAARLAAEGVNAYFLPLSLFQRIGAENIQQTKSEDAEKELFLILSRYAKSCDVSLEQITISRVAGELIATPRVARSSGEIQVVIPFRDNFSMTAKCLEGLAKQDAAADLFITLVDNNSTQAALDELNRFIQSFPLGERIEVVSDTGYFNFARLNNVGTARHATPFILFLNNDVELHQPETLAELRSWCAIPDVGAVGGCLVYDDGRVQHAGINFASVRPMNVATSAHFDYVFREVNGVTFAMALVKRTAFNALGGLDEERCPNGFGDALFCSNLPGVGYRVLYTPRARAVHRESQSRGLSPEDIELLEMERSGLPIADLFADFSAEKQPMVLDLKMQSAPAFQRLVGGVNRSQKLLRAANFVSSAVLPAAQLALSLRRRARANRQRKG